MSNTNTESFEKQWEKFITRLKGKLLNENSKQPLSYPLCSLILNDIKLNWASEYEEGGRWLKNYKAENPQKGQLIYNILVEDIAFTEITPKKASKSSGFILPVVGAVAGFGISSIFRADFLIRAIATIAPAVLLFATGKAKSNASKENNSVIDEYLQQLDKFKVSVISILEN